VQTVAAVSAVYVPAEQAVQPPAPAAENVPVPHCWHVAREFIPVPVLKVPATQAVHDRAPLDRQPPYCPLGQGGHGRMIMGEYVSPLKLYRALTSLEDRAFV
jgi:hypothetical protein